MRHQTENNWRDCTGLKRASEIKLVRWKRRRRSTKMMALKRMSGMRTKIHELIVPEVPFDQLNFIFIFLFDSFVFNRLYI